MVHDFHKQDITQSAGVPIFPHFSAVILVDTYLVQSYIHRWSLLEGVAVSEVQHNRWRSSVLAAKTVLTETNCPANNNIKKVKFSRTHYRALGPELIPVYRQSVRSTQHWDIIIPQPSHQTKDTCTSPSLFIAPATTETHHQDTFRPSRFSLHCTYCLEISEQLHCR